MATVVLILKGCLLLEGQLMIVQLEVGNSSLSEWLCCVNLV